MKSVSTTSINSLSHSPDIQRHSFIQQSHQTAKTTQKVSSEKGEVKNTVSSNQPSAFQILEYLLPFLDRHRVQELLQPFHATFPVSTQNGSDIESHTL